MGSTNMVVSRKMTGRQLIAEMLNGCSHGCRLDRRSIYSGLTRRPARLPLQAGTHPAHRQEKFPDPLLLGFAKPLGLSLVASLVELAISVEHWLPVSTRTGDLA